MAHQGHLKEVASRLDAVVVQVQLVAQMGDSVFRLAQRHLARFGSHSDMEFAVASGSAFRFS